MNTAQRVLAGALWLDLVRPGWRDLVDMDSLDMRDPQRCVLGQVFAAEAERDDHLWWEDLTGYRWAENEFDLGSWRDGRGRGLDSMGFCAVAMVAEWDELQALWRVAIAS